MAKLKLKTLKINNNCNKTIAEIHGEYMDYCKAIGQRDGTLESKSAFYKYEFPKIVNVEGSINQFTKQLIEKHINNMIDKGYKGNYYQTFVTGCRSETLLNLRIKDVNFETDSILFRHMNITL